MTASADTPRTAQRRRPSPDRTAVASHEMRGPLGVVEAVSDLLLARDLPAEERRLVELIRLAGAHALAVADDLVAEASLGAGRFRVVPGRVSPADLVRSVADLWTPMVADGARRLAVAVAPDCPEAIVSDAGRLRQILFNLVSNAAKAAEHGAITIAVGPAGAGRVAFEVTDEGPGLPPDFAPEPFADPADRPLPGAGLGLWISARIAAALGGALLLETRPDGGTRALLDLPCEPARAGERRRPPRKSSRRRDRPAEPARLETPVDETASPAPSGPAPVEEAMIPTDDDHTAPGVFAASPLAGRRVLVVDDSAVSRMLLDTILASFDMTVDVAAGGAEACRIAAAARPDVIVLDWALARETGADVLAALDRVLPDGLPPVISVSANAKAMLGPGAAVHVTKPFTPRELHGALETAMAGDAFAASAG